MYCEKCDFTTNIKYKWERHIKTQKHNNNNNINIFSCNCGKTYKYSQGLTKHKKTCNLIIDLIKQNNEFKKIIIEQSKENKKFQQQILLEVSKPQIINNNNYNTNSNNINNTNNFNLNFFLNEQCKDALNIEEFINQIKVQLCDLDMIGKVGYVEGITEIFLKNLKLLDIYKRPIHCSDYKRETLYVKDNDSWEKENDENKKIKKVIKGIEYKNMDQLPQWMDKNPAYNDYDSKKHMEYHHIVIESMGGPTDKTDDDKNKNKIVRNIAKEVIINKTK